jgi:hypothetical protein
MADAKTIILLSFILFSMLAGGCEEKSNPVAQYGDALISVHEGSKIEAQQATLQGIKNAVQVYYASNGRYPENLDEIQKLMDSPIDVSMYDYNPQNGSVALKGQ